MRVIKTQFRHLFIIFLVAWILSSKFSYLAKCYIKAEKLVNTKNLQVMKLGPTDLLAMTTNLSLMTSHALRQV